MEMRKFWKSWEFWSGIGIGAILFSFLPFNEFAKLTSLVLDAYVVSRALFKKNRGMYYSASYASETYAFVLNTILLSAGVYLFGMDRLQAGYYLAGAYAAFALCRGVTKHLVPSTTKTVVMR